MATYVLQNEQLCVTCDTHGAEVISVRRGNCEYVWQGDPAYWTGRAPMMFPICGRLADDAYTYEGKTYSMRQHGFLRNSELEMAERTEESLRFVLRANQETRAIYPFDFVLTVTHTLQGDTVRTLVCVQNTGADVLPFAFGAHPAFNLPMAGEGTFEDCYIEFGEPCSPDEILKSESNLISGKHRAYPLADGLTLPLSHRLFDNDSIFFARAADRVTLRSERSERSVTLHYPQFPFLGIWHKPKTDAPYLCIEPWCGLPSYEGEEENLATKPNMFRLRAGESKTLSFAISYR